MVSGPSVVLKPKPDGVLRPGAPGSFRICHLCSEQGFTAYGAGCISAQSKGLRLTVHGVGFGGPALSAAFASAISAQCRGLGFRATLSP